MLLRLKVPKESCVVLEKSAFTLFYTPSRETLHVDSERLSCGNYQPMMPSIQEMTEELHALLLQREPLVVANCLGRADMMLSGALIQFSDHSGITSNDLEIIPDFSSIAQLKDMFVARSAKDGCLNAVQQLTKRCGLQEMILDERSCFCGQLLVNMRGGLIAVYC